MSITHTLKESLVKTNLKDSFFIIFIWIDYVADHRLMVSSVFVEKGI